MPKWWNWYTRYFEVVVAVRLCKFESCLGHHQWNRNTKTVADAAVFVFSCFRETVSFYWFHKVFTSAGYLFFIYMLTLRWNFFTFACKIKIIDDSDFWKIDVRVREGYLNVSNTVSMLIDVTWNDQKYVLDYRKGEKEKRSWQIIEIMEEKIRTLFKQYNGNEARRVEPLPVSGSARRYYRVFTEDRTYVGVYHENLRENRLFVDFTRDRKSVV